MLTIHARPYAREADLEAIVELQNICRAVDPQDEVFTLQELRDEYAHPDMDMTRDLRLWEDADGTLLAFGEMWVPSTGDNGDGSLWFQIHPSARDTDLSAEIIAWGEARMREVAQQRNITKPLLRCSARDVQAERLALLQQHGFAVARYFFRMARDLAAPMPEAEWPQGFTLRHVAGEHEIPAWVECYNQSFIDHWNHHPRTVEQQMHWVRTPTYRPELDLVAVADDGTFAAFCFCSINLEANTLAGNHEGWINLLGTRRGYRKLGLGRAMLLAGLSTIKAQGMDTALLGVDAENPTGALHLYESVGFTPVRTYVSHVKAL